MKRFINRESELAALNEQYVSKDASLVVIYGRRRIGKTTLIREFIKDKKALYFLAREESDAGSIKRFAKALAEYTGQEYIEKIAFDDWQDVFKLFSDYTIDERKLLIIDELPYLVDANPSFPSILQWVWDEWFQNQNAMLILCGSLINMMEKHTLNYASPLYGRRTAQIKMRQIEFSHYDEFFPNLSYKDLVEHYAVTGGVPKYIELFDERKNLLSEIERLILSPNGLLFEEPEFLLRHEVQEIGSYFSIIKSIAQGNQKPGKISSDIGIKQTSLPKYLKTLIDLDILEREVPVTDSGSDRKKISLYRIGDNFIRFWFRFVYPELGRLELGQSEYVLDNIKTHITDNHIAHAYEHICRSEMWQLSAAGEIRFNKIGRWWNSNTEIDIVALDSTGDDIVFAECKYRKKPTDADVFYELLRKKNIVQWKIGNRREKFVLFSISGFTGRLVELSKERDDLLLIGENGTVVRDTGIT